MWADGGTAAFQGISKRLSNLAMAIPIFDDEEQQAYNKKNQDVAFILSDGQGKAPHHS